MDDEWNAPYPVKLGKRFPGMANGAVGRDDTARVCVRWLQSTTRRGKKGSSTVASVDDLHFPSGTAVDAG